MRKSARPGWVGELAGFARQVMFFLLSDADVPSDLDNAEFEAMKKPLPESGPEGAFCEPVISMADSNN